ncbi:immunity 53 family protein [Deminuibacter soli]|uniref:Rhodanese-related sulfurtransferase n=1 Tax=Deminuibacter soli TaxID=2291815 RepID=A0A3E1NCW0_9BACT|nr:immunity 53 family protein [Deminuibacter soli]RFM25826.1 hypothetical protein DXN05_22975 [Deminuibacter soli]
MQNIIDWISSWMVSQCDGDWEHEYGIKIETLDNPGWLIKIDLTDTELENWDFDGGLVEKNDDDWYTYKVEDKCFTGVGDLFKLEFLLGKFKELVESNGGYEPGC